MAAFIDGVSVHQSKVGLLNNWSDLQTQLEQQHRTQRGYSKLTTLRYWLKIAKRRPWQFFLEASIRYRGA